MDASISVEPSTAFLMMLCERLSVIENRLDHHEAMATDKYIRDMKVNEVYETRFIGIDQPPGMTVKIADEFVHHADVSVRREWPRFNPQRIRAAVIELHQSKVVLDRQEFVRRKAFGADILKAHDECYVSDNIPRSDEIGLKSWTHVFAVDEADQIVLDTTLNRELFSEVIIESSLEDDAAKLLLIAKSSVPLKVLIREAITLFREAGITGSPGAFTVTPYQPWAAARLNLLRQLRDDPSPTLKADLLKQLKTTRREQAYLDNQEWSIDFPEPHRG